MLGCVQPHSSDLSSEHPDAGRLELDIVWDQVPASSAVQQEPLNPGSASAWRVHVIDPAHAQTYGHSAFSLHVCLGHPSHTWPGMAVPGSMTLAACSCRRVCWVTLKLESTLSHDTTARLLYAIRGFQLFLRRARSRRGCVSG